MYEDAKGDELIDILGDGAEESCQRIDGKASYQNEAAAVFIAQRPPEEHSRGKNDEEEYQREIDLLS